jgi:hypothetical protein
MRGFHRFRRSSIEDVPPACDGQKEKGGNRGGNAAAGFRQMIGYIAAANVASLKLHEGFGFRQVGYLPSVGYKFGHWTDTVMVQRSLGPGATEPPAA